MVKKLERIVYRREDGKWVNKRVNSKSDISVHATMHEAENAARTALKTGGGGDLVVVGNNGRIRSKDTISLGKLIPKARVKREFLVIYCGSQSDGFTFRISPRSLEYIHTVLSTPPFSNAIFISNDNRISFESIHGSFLKQVASLLTNLSQSQLVTAGGYIIKDSASGKILHDARVKV